MFVMVLCQLRLEISQNGHKSTYKTDESHSSAWFFFLVLILKVSIKSSKFLVNISDFIIFTLKTQKVNQWCRCCVEMYICFVNLSSLTLDWHVRQLVMHKKMKHDPLKKHTEWTLKLQKSPIARASCYSKQERERKKTIRPVKYASTCSVTALHTA